MTSDILLAALLGMALGYSLCSWWQRTRRDPDEGILAARLRAYREGRGQ
jgi:hypothetical protein